MIQPPNMGTGMKYERWTRGLDVAAKYLSVFQALFLVVTGVTGYFLVTKVRQSLEDQKFLLGISGYISDLKPALNFECEATVMGDGRIQVYAKATNVGKNVVVTKSYDRIIVSLKDYKQVGINSGGYSSSVEFAPNDFSIDHSTFKVDPSIDPYQTEARVFVNLATDPAVMAIAHSVLGDRLTVDELKSLGTKTMSCTAQPAQPPPAPMPPPPSG
jgi:hypothetical protein